MSYIGRDINNLSDRVKLDSISTSATATFNLLLNSVAYVPSSAESLTVSLNGVIQAPQSSYTVSGSTIIFASNLASSDVIDFILAERAITLSTIGSGTVTTSNIVDDAVTSAKVNLTDELHINSTASGNTLHTLLKLETDGTADGSGITIDTRTAHTRGEINFLDGTGSYDSNYVFKTATGSQLATPTEKFRVSPTGATVTGDLTITGSIVGGGVGGNTPNFCVIEGGQQTLQHNTYTNLDFGTEIVDSNNAFTSNKFTVPSGQGGTYYLECQINFYDAQGKLSSGMIALWKGNNGTKLSNLYNVYTGAEASHLSFSVSTLAVLNAGDVIGAAATITTTDGLSVTSYGGDGGSRIMGFKVS